jgi:2-polyprenyl-3-methyl-5-hydroxy-6-metoxy-1,4-benzoquinol methylase
VWLLDMPWPAPVAAILTQQISEPDEERQLRAAMPRLTKIDDEVSRLVRDQYEENPYPRWVRIEPAGDSRHIIPYLSQKFPRAAFRRDASKATADVLIAGCGTGQQSIGMAQTLKDARILAVDLSLSSLGYARRKTQELGLTSIDYAQADLLELGSIDRQFDVIASVGVLHHLADPFAGWRVLLSLLRPGGFMNLGFYSELARRNIVKARSFVAAHGSSATADEIRRRRQDVLDRRADFGKTVDLLDFYSMSTCRDLLFHAQEHRMTLAGIEAFLRDNGLTFLGFEIDGNVLHAYRRRFANDPAATDLAQWQVFETDNPDIFIGMYQFWIQKSR